MNERRSEKKRLHASCLPHLLTFQVSRELIMETADNKQIFVRLVFYELYANCVRFRWNYSGRKFMLNDSEDAP